MESDKRVPVPLVFEAITIFSVINDGLRTQVELMLALKTKREDAGNTRTA